MEKIKICFLATISLIISLWSKLSLPLILLILSNIMDLGTGIIKSYYLKKNLTFRIFMWGIIKKLSMYILITVGYIIDLLIIYTVENFEIAIGISGFVGNLIAIYLILDEQLSILKNLMLLDIPMPNYLIKLVTKFKEEINNKGKI